MTQVVRCPIGLFYNHPLLEEPYPVKTPLTHPRIILDTDPGGDDIYAFLWLLSLVKSGLAELVAVTSADGNVAAKRTFSSASQIFFSACGNFTILGTGEKAR